MMMAMISGVRVKSLVIRFGPDGGDPARQRPAPERRAPLAAYARGRLRSRVAAITCSTAWNEPVAAKAEERGIDPNTHQIARQLREHGIYPPPCDLGRGKVARRHGVRMRKCDACGRIVPPNNLAEHRLVRVCDDCRAEPEVDLDRNSSEIARAPGVRDCTLVEGRDDVDGGRQAAREQLRTLGLSDQEIMVLAFTNAGYSTRRVAEFGQWSQTYVRKVIASAGRKLRRSGLRVPERQVVEASGRATVVDPVKLDGMSERVR